MIKKLLKGNQFLRNEADGVESGGGGGEGNPNIGQTQQAEEMQAPPPDEPSLHEFSKYMESPESLASYRQAMGIPDNVDAYEIALGEGESLNEADAAFLKKAGVDHGIPPSAMSALARDYLAAHSKAAAEQEAQYEAGFKQLAGEWGADYDSKMADAKLAASKVCAAAGIPMDVLKESDFGSSAEAFKLFSFVGSLIKEGKAKGIEGAEVTSGQTEARRIESDPSHPLHEAYMDHRHPNHAYANQVYDRAMGLGGK